MDVKIAEADKKKMDQLNAYKKVFVGGLEPTVDASNINYDKFRRSKNLF